MVKPKQRLNHRVPGKKHQNQRSSNADPPDDGDWMVVKKQRITIIIPPLPNKEHSAMPSVGDDHLQEMPIRSITNSPLPRKSNSQLQCPSANSASKLSVHEPEKSMSSAEQAVQPHPQPQPQPQPQLLLEAPNVNFEKPLSQTQRTTSDIPPLRSHKELKENIGPCSIPRARPRINIVADSTSFMNQRMRASYLEKKLRTAGGLENWLVSLGLARFVKVFQMRRVGKFQLANLTMQKLKDMGTDAVGPRRKLMHAIDCLCEPHCFKHV